MLTLRTRHCAVLRHHGWLLVVHNGKWVVEVMRKGMKSRKMWTCERVPAIRMGVLNSMTYQEGELRGGLGKSISYGGRSCMGPPTLDD